MKHVNVPFTFFSELTALTVSCEQHSVRSALPVSLRRISLVHVASLENYAKALEKCTNLTALTVIKNFTDACSENLVWALDAAMEKFVRLKRLNMQIKSNAVSIPLSLVALTYTAIHETDLRHLTNLRRLHLNNSTKRAIYFPTRLDELVLKGPIPPRSNMNEVHVNYLGLEDHPTVHPSVFPHAKIKTTCPTIQCLID